MKTSYYVDLTEVSQEHRMQVAQIVKNADCFASLKDCLQVVQSVTLGMRTHSAAVLKSFQSEEEAESFHKLLTQVPTAKAVIVSALENPNE